MIKHLLIGIVAGLAAGVLMGEGVPLAIHAVESMIGGSIGKSCEAEGHATLSPAWKHCVGEKAGRALDQLLFPDAHADDIEVVDGDTVKIDGVSWRLQGYDTPETYFAKCDEEYGAGIIAKQEFEGLLRQARKVEPVTDGRTDRYGRTLGRLYLDGRDIADIMVETGLARRYTGRTKRKGWCDEPE